MTAEQKLSIVVVSAARERLYMAAMVAAVGAVSGTQVNVFLSMNALQFFVKGTASTPEPEGAFGRLMAEKNMPDFKTLFEQAVTLGSARISPCSMAMDVMDLQQDALESYLGESMGLTKFLDEAGDGQLLSF